MSRLYVCTACGVEVARRRDHTESDCQPRIVGLARDAHLAQLQRRVDELSHELGEPSREVAS